MIEIIPAVLEKDFNRLQEKAEKLEAYFKKAQIDIGDGKFVPGVFGCLDKLGRLKTDLALEAHLMVEEPWKYLSDLQKSTFSKITFHYEAFQAIPKKTRPFAINNLIKGIKGIKGMIRENKGRIKIGIAIKPETNPVQIVQYLERIDEVLLLGVNPGKQGRKFSSEILEKVNYIKNFRNDIEIGVDGGVNDKNIRRIAEVGVDKVYVGSYLWKQELNKSIRILTNEIQIANDANRE